LRIKSLFFSSLELNGLQRKSEGIGIFLISHEIADVFDLADRVAVMKNGQVVGCAKTGDVDKGEVPGILG
jgi:D-xylose transport system ATP-binding protein